MIYHATPSSHKRIDLNNSELGEMVRKTLQALEADPIYNTIGSFTTDNEKYPTGLKPFVDTQMHYLQTHPTLSPEHHLANLKIKLKIRS